MRRLVASVASVFTLVFILTATAGAADHKYTGSDKCKVCHMAAKKGNQYGKWKETKHSKAFETLASPAAKEVAKKAGVPTLRKTPHVFVPRDRFCRPGGNERRQV